MMLARTHMSIYMYPAVEPIFTPIIVCCFVILVIFVLLVLVVLVVLDVLVVLVVLSCRV